MYVSQGDILTFDNGMIGCVTASNKIALVGRNGCAIQSKYMPLLTNYNAMHRIVRIEERHGDDAPLELVWEDETFFADLKAKKQHYYNDQRQAA